jgi:hypothetical protein
MGVCVTYVRYLNTDTHTETHTQRHTPVRVVVLHLLPQRADNARFLGRAEAVADDHDGVGSGVLCKNK